LTHRVHVVEIQGDSYRLQASLKAKNADFRGPKFDENFRV
jgi:hypothetical protein